MPPSIRFRSSASAPQPGAQCAHALLGALPPRPGLALVVIQHLDPQHESRLNELLQPHTSMAVVEASHGSKSRPITST